jgi:hypothetical protein
MNEILLMKIITGLCIVTILFIYVFPKLNIKFNLESYKFTENSFKGFNSFNEFLNYFRFAFNFTLKNKFAILLPADLLGRLSHFQPIIMTLSACIQLFLAVIFYIAFFKFYIDTQQQSDQNAVI